MKDIFFKLKRLMNQQSEGCLCGTQEYLCGTYFKARNFRKSVDSRSSQMTQCFHNESFGRIYFRELRKKCMAMTILTE